MHAKNINILHEASLGRQERLASWIADHVGTIYFFYFCCLLTVIPLLFTRLLPVVQFISSAFLQLVLLPIILIAQNLQSRHDAIKADHEYQLNKQEEKQNELILQKLDKILEIRYYGTTKH